MLQYAVVTIIVPLALQTLLAVSEKYLIYNCKEYYILFMVQDKYTFLRKIFIHILLNVPELFLLSRSSGLLSLTADETPLSYRGQIIHQ